MISGLYTAASGLIAQTQQQDVISNNLANVNTNGYKKDTALYVPFPTVFLNRINDDRTPVPGGMADMMTPIGSMGRGVELRADGVRPQITEEGSYIQTDNKLDLAIKGNAMFMVMTANGVRYTRDGNFSLDSDGRIVTQSGAPLLGQAGEIIITGDDVHIDEGGRVFSGGHEIDTLRLAVFDRDSDLRKEGDNLFYKLDGVPLDEDDYVDTVQVKQGYLESSNVNVVREMVDMITAYRAYEAAQKAVQSQDQTLDKSVNDVGRISI
ncbi:MAG: flagellar hook-basal body protein [Spirochaetia bacterium]|nr:flagellar hook-basal body protein [Spirochaetia bacterium]